MMVFFRKGSPYSSLGLDPIWWFAIFFVALFLLLRLSTPISTNRWFEVGYSLPFLWMVFRYSDYRRLDWGLRWLLLLALVPVVQFFILRLQLPDEVSKLYSYDKLIKMGFFMMLGFWLLGDFRIVKLFWILALIGLLFALFSYDLGHSFLRALRGFRVDFGIHNAQHTAMFTGLACIVLFFYRPRLIDPIFRTWFNVLVWLFWLLSFIVLLIAFLGSQTRAAWVAVLFIFPLVVVKHLFNRQLGWVRFAPLLLIPLFPLVFSLAPVRGILFRLKSEWPVFVQFVSGDWAGIPANSLGIRLLTWIEALDWINQRPFFGWGGNVRHQVFLDSPDLVAKVGGSFGHFHNSYIEFLLAYGLVGLVSILIPIFWINWRIISIAKKDKQWVPLANATFFGSLFLCLINLFESYWFFWPGVVATSVLLAPAYSVHLSKIFKDEKEHNYIAHKSMILSPLCIWLKNKLMVEPLEDQGSAACSEEHRLRIVALKKLLADSDFKVLPDYDKPVENLYEQRQKWRDEIRILEGRSL